MVYFDYVTMLRKIMWYMYYKAGTFRGARCMETVSNTLKQQKQ
jgi:hypothetical protein